MEAVELGGDDLVQADRAAAEFEAGVDAGEFQQVGDQGAGSPGLADQEEF